MCDEMVERAIDYIRAKSVGPAKTSCYSVTINFHPDRLTSNAVPLLTAMSRDREIKSQFETGTSNGGLTAYKGGDRWTWEHRMFGGAYDSAPNDARPKYGGLNFRDYEDGACPRFGSAHFRLKPHILNRTTFCYPDSTFEPYDFATVDYLEPLVALANGGQLDLLDDYIEAHVHGVISLAHDVECIVLDPIYKSTEIERQANKLNIPVRWHAGYELSIETMARYPNYRGKRIIQLANELALDGIVNPKLLGVAANEHSFDIQDVKKIWHYLSRYGYLGHVPSSILCAVVLV